MTKHDILQFLEPFTDETEIVIRQDDNIIRWDLGYSLRKGYGEVNIHIFGWTLSPVIGTDNHYCKERK